MPTDESFCTNAWDCFGTMRCSKGLLRTGFETPGFEVAGPLVGASGPGVGTFDFDLTG